jgi:hypothetical protein
MSERTKVGKAGGRDTSKSTKTARKTAQPKSAPGSKGRAAGDFDFIGRVTRIHVKDSPSGPVCEFALHGRKGARQSFRISTAHDSAMMAMVQIVIAAHDRDAKIGVRSKEGGEGLPVTTEIAWRPKSGKGN